MKEILEEIKKLDDMDQKPIAESMCKLFEEFGEFTQEVNKMIGMKVHNETHSEIREKLLEEMGDLIQNILLIGSRFDIDIEELETEIKKCNKKWLNKVIERKN